MGRRIGRKMNEQSRGNKGLMYVLRHQQHYCSVKYSNTGHVEYTHIYTYTQVDLSTDLQGVVNREQAGLIGRPQWCVASSIWSFPCFCFRGSYLWSFDCPYSIKKRRKRRRRGRSSRSGRGRQGLCWPTVTRICNRKGASCDVPFDRKGR